MLVAQLFLLQAQYLGKQQLACSARLWFLTTKATLWNKGFSFQQADFFA